MALNKRKVLDAARKHAQKGAKAKALKEYEKLLKADPRDAKLLLEVGDAYRRWGQAEDAIAQYSKVAAQYRQDGFDARAVAVFKQILNLDPKQYSAFVSLSELYQRMGLDSEAAAALQMAADGYHKEGRKTEALELLRQMGALDPTNTTSRTKVAELLRQEGLTEEALAEYEAIAGELGNQQDRDQLIVIQERILEIAPNHVQTLSSLARTLMGSGELDRAEPYAAQAAAAAPEPPQFELLMDLYAQMGNDEGLSNATRGLAKLFRDRGDEDKARELMQRLSTDEVMPAEGGRLTVDLSEVEEPQLGDDELLEDEPFLTLDDDDGFGASASRPSLDFEEVSLDTPAPPAAEPAAEAAAKTAPPAATPQAAPPEGDPDQLLAEASVYLRYGKRDQAFASLETVLAIEPQHVGALEKLGEWHAEGDDTGEAVKVWLGAIEIARGSGDSDALDRIKEKISAVDPEVATSISSGEGDDSVPSITGVGADLSDAVEAGPDLDLEADLDLDDAIDAVAESETETGFPAGSPESTSTTFEIELDDDSIVFDEAPQTDVDMAEHTQPGFELTPETSQADTLESDEADDGDDSIDFEIDVDMDGFDEDGEELAADAPIPEATPEAEAEAAAPAAAAAMDDAQISEELEEAEFYVAQDMFDEAEAILARVLEASPAHAEALVMSGEIAAARGIANESDSETGAADVAADEVDADSASMLDAETGPDPVLGDEATAESETDAAGDEIEFEMDLDDDADEDATPDLEAALAEAASAVPHAEESEEDAPVDDEVAFELDLGDPNDGLSDDLVLEPDSAPEPEPDLEITADAAPDLEVADEDTPSEEAIAAEAAPAPEEAGFESFDDVTADASEPEVDAAVAEAAQGEAGESFDLREALADVLEEDGDAGAPAEGVLSTVEDGFGSIFSDFKKGVTETLDEGDYDTRYDLGIAYREMGLFDDAIAEFRMCLGSAERKFDSLYLMGLCARDLERWDDAINHLEQALSLPDLQEERMAGVYFDLSVAHEGAGDLHRAASIVRRVLELEPDFPGAGERLARLESGETSIPDLGTPGEAYESFDDLFDADGDDEDGDAGMAEAAPAETYESFEDVVDMTDEIGVSDEAEPIAEVELAEETPPTPEDPPATSGSKKSGRRKISFV